MKSRQEQLDEWERRKRFRKTFFANIILYPLCIGFFILSFLCIDYLIGLQPASVILFIPASLTILITINAWFSKTGYRPPYKQIAIVLLCLLLMVNVFYVIDNQFGSIKTLDLYVMVLISFCLFNKTVLGSPENKSQVPTLTALVSYSIIPLFFFLSFHLFTFDFIVFHPKSEMSFSHTLISPSSVKDLIDEINNRPFDEQFALRDDPFIKMLQSFGVVTINDNYFTPLGFTNEFTRKHNDAIVQLKYDEQLKNEFFPSGYYSYSESYYIGEYFLKNIQVKYNTEFNTTHEIRLLFKKMDNSDYVVFTSKDIDNADSTFSAPVDHPDLGQFNVNGKYHFAKRPDEQKGRETSISAVYSTIGAERTMLFYHFKPQIAK